MLFSLLRSCPISVVPSQITTQFWLEGTPIETLLDAGMKPKSPRAASSNDQRDGDAADADGDVGDSVFPADIVLCGSLLTEWFRRRHGQRGQCPHDALTVHAACYPTPSPGADDESSHQCLRYARGTFVGHEWVATSHSSRARTGRTGWRWRHQATTAAPRGWRGSASGSSSTYVCLAQQRLLRVWLAFSWSCLGF